MWKIAKCAAGRSSSQSSAISAGHWWRCRCGAWTEVRTGVIDDRIATAGRWLRAHAVAGPRRLQPAGGRRPGRRQGPAHARPVAAVLGALPRGVLQGRTEVCGRGRAPRVRRADAGLERAGHRRPGGAAQATARRGGLLQRRAAERSGALRARAPLYGDRQRALLAGPRAFPLHQSGLVHREARSGRVPDAQLRTAREAPQGLHRLRPRHTEDLRADPGEPQDAAAGDLHQVRHRRLRRLRQLLSPRRRRRVCERAGPGRAGGACGRGCRRRPGDGRTQELARGRARARHPGVRPGRAAVPGDAAGHRARRPAGRAAAGDRQCGP